jgi:hypothetical protein
MAVLRLIQIANSSVSRFCLRVIEIMERVGDFL